MQHTITLPASQLHFPNLHLLWAFAQTLKSSYTEINTREMTLACICSEEDISRAILEYQATLHTNQSEAQR